MLHYYSAVDGNTQDSDPRVQVWDATSRGFIPPLREHLHAPRPLILSSRHRAVERFGSSEHFGYDTSNHRGDVWRPAPIAQGRGDMFFNDAPHDFMSALDAGDCQRARVAASVCVRNRLPPLIPAIFQTLFPTAATATCRTGEFLNSSDCVKV